MSEWTDADVEAVAEALGCSNHGADYLGGCVDCLSAAERVRDSGVVVPARAVEEAEAAGYAKGHEAAMRYAEEALTGPRSELSRLRSAIEALADEWQGSGLNAATTLRALLTEGPDRAGEGAGS